jgi:hypothetical protein
MHSPGQMCIEREQMERLNYEEKEPRIESTTKQQFTDLNRSQRF